MGDDPLAWLATEGADPPEGPQVAISGPAEVEGDTWSSPARQLLQERSERNRHGPDCECVRCQPLQHGAYESDIEVTEQVAALVELLPDQHPANRVPVELLAITLTRVRRAMLALEKADSEGRLEDCLRLSADAKGWVGHAEKLAERLGLTPSGRAGLGLTEAETARHRVAAVLGALDLSRLDEGDLQELERVLVKARPQELGR